MQIITAKLYAIHISTPKGQSRHRDTPPSNVIRNTIWKDDPTHHWIINEHGLWDKDHAHSTPVQPPHMTPDNATYNPKGTTLDSTLILNGEDHTSISLRHYRMVKWSLVYAQILYKIRLVQTRMQQASDPSYTNVKILTHTSLGESKPTKQKLLAQEKDYYHGYKKKGYAQWYLSRSLKKQQAPLFSLP